MACGCASLVRCTVKGARSKLNRSVSPEKLPNSSHADQLIVLIFVRVLSYESIFVSYESTSGSTFVRKYVYTYCSLLAIGHMFSPDGYRAQVFLQSDLHCAVCTYESTSEVRKYNVVRKYRVVVLPEVRKYTLHTILSKVHVH